MQFEHTADEIVGWLKEAEFENSKFIPSDVAGSKIEKSKFIPRDVTGAEHDNSIFILDNVTHEKN